MNKDKIFNCTFYAAIGLAAALSLFIIFYKVLLLDSSIAGLMKNVSGSYLWAYAGLTFGTVILFGANAALFTYRIRKYGWPKLSGQFSAGAGSVIGIFASACPVCGSTLLSALGVAGGLSSFPLRGLELKALAFVLMALPVWLLIREMRKFECLPARAGGTAICPKPRDASFKEVDAPWLIILLALVIGLFFVSFNMLSADHTVAIKCAGILS